MLRSLFIVFPALVALAHSILIHKRMTREEVRATFQNGQGPVPDYEVVSVFHTLHKHDARDNSNMAVRVNAFEREMSLYLEPNDGLLADFSTPVWTVSSDDENPGNVEYTLVPNAFAKIGRAYQDRSKRSAIIAYEGEDGETLILGNLHSDLIIRPLPHRLHETIARETKNLNDSLPNLMDVDENYRRTHHHVVFKRQEPDMNSTLRIVKRDRYSNRIGNERSKRNIPGIIYPEILVIVDYTLYAVLGENVEEATRYILALWNAVDLRYRLLAEPTIRLNIAGIIISLNTGGTPYLDNNQRGITEVDADRAIADMSYYFYKESSRFNFSYYDMAVAMTHLDMCNVFMNDICDTSTLGYAYEWGACNRSHVDQNTEAVGIVEDNGGFKAIIATAHEVAHLMGVSHDGFEESTQCPGYDGYIMSASLNAGENSFSWSNCSLKHLHEFFSSEEATCLFNEPRSGMALPRILPGKLKTLDEQCEKIYGTRACYHDERVCTRLECYIPGRGEFCLAQTSAAEGSYCGNGLHCINGHCVNVNATFVPYTPSTTRKPFERVFPNDDFWQRPILNFTRYDKMTSDEKIE